MGGGRGWVGWEGGMAGAGVRERSLGLARRGGASLLTPPPPKHTPTHLLSQVLLVDAEKGAIVVKGAVPGKRGNIVEVAPTKVVGVNV